MLELIKFSLLLFYAIDTNANKCVYTDDTCEFYLTVEHKLTMMDYKSLVIPSKGKLYRYNVQNTSSATPIPVDRVITADGHIESRVVTAVNNTVPGPPIIVYEGQTVIIHVTNNLTSDGTTIHWHGLPQRGTPWMDGVAYITQCPIMPGQTFTYKFTAKPVGTYWYHSHIGAQRSMGVYGAFIIREKKRPQIEERILTIRDFNHDWNSDLAQMKMTYGVFKRGKKISNTKSIEGAYFSMFTFQSGLINGRGRYHDPETGTHNEAPLSVINVRQGNQYRFRMIGTGTLYPFRVSIDQHKLKVIASDGYDLEPITVDSIIINPGERYDFILTANKSISNYWIRAETLERDLNHRTEAILRYDGANDEEPVSKSILCSDSYRCKVLNCPFSIFPPSYHADCINFDVLKSNHDDDPAVVSHVEPSNRPWIPPVAGLIGKRDAPSDPTGPDIEYFLNFAFPGKTWTPGSVNGIKLKFPPVSALTQANEITSEYKCANFYCQEDEVCYCFNTLTLEHNQTVQMIFLNMGKGKGWAHPIHMHGHSFQVLKMGFPQYDSKGQLIGDNLDINCHGDPNRNKSFCNKATWSQSNWGGNNIPGLELKKPPRKDTIMVPSGGYVVVRIQADNPGLWFMHCHIELHNLDGMAMAINESFGKVPDPPPGFPECRNYPTPSTNTRRRRDVNLDVEPFEYHQKPIKGDETHTAVWLLPGALAVIVVVQGIIIGKMYFRSKKLE